MHPEGAKGAENEQISLQILFPVLFVFGDWWSFQKEIDWAVDQAE